MTDLFIQSSLAVSKNQQLVEEAVRIRQICTAEHGGKQNLAECPECFEKVLEAARLRYLKPADDKSKKEWFSSRRTFLRDLDSMFADAKDYQRDPRAIDSRVREEKSRWYAETVRTSLLRLMVADSNKIGRPGREAILEKLKDPKSAKLAEVAKDISAMLGASGNATATREATSGDSEFLRRLASSSLPAGDSGAATRRLDLFKEAFFDGGRDDNRQGTAQKSQQRYIEMLGQGQSMDQVVDRILEERQAATGVREQTARLKKRLDELRRARAAHEVEKSKKAARRQKAASASASSSTSGNASTIFVASQPPFGQPRNQQQGSSSQPPDEPPHTVPPCAVCGNTPGAGDFICCPVCAILAGHKAAQPQQKQKQWQPTVYCSQGCGDKGHTSHLETTHTCASGEECIQLQDHHGATNEKHADNINVKTEADRDNTSSSSNTSMKHDSRNDDNTIVISSDSICFCAECLTSLKIATLWCSLGCADKNFQRHREAVHLVERKRVGIAPNDNDRQALHFLDEERGGTKHPRYRAKNIAQHVVSFPAAVRAWEEQNGVGSSSR